MSDVEVPGGMPGMPRRIGIVVEDADGRVWSFETTDVQNAELRIDYPDTQQVDFGGPNPAQALAQAMMRKRVKLSFWTAQPWKWRVR